jgi:hypothetical protein
MNPMRLVRTAAAALLAVAPAIATLAAPVPAAAQGGTVITYSVREARAYAYRVSLSKEVIEAAQTAQPCHPEDDPYHCDDAAYEHKPNCPKPLVLGPRRPGPEAAPPPGLEGESGGAGDQLGAADSPPLASPVTLNQYLTLGNLSRLGNTLEAGGFATDSYVDLSGRREPSMHTESDAFSGNRNPYEERCSPEATEEENAHYVSRSFRTPETYHLAECHGNECQFGPLLFGAEAKDAVTMVHLVERAGRLHGRLHATLQRASWGGGALTADLVDTTVEFSTDGTASGLEYTAATTAAGVELAGTPITLPPGRALELPGMQIGLAAPYIQAADDGRTLDVIAAGLYFASDRQTLLFGGAELHATMSREPAPSAGTGGDDDTPIDVGGSGIDDSLTPPAGPLPSPSTASPAAPGASPAAPEPELAVSRIQTGTWVVPMLLGAGILAAALLVVRWASGSPWGRRLNRVQPFRALDWMYRAFVKS